MLGRKHHCVVHCKVAVAFNGNTALSLSCAEQLCGIQTGEDSVKRGKQLATVAVVVVICLRNALRRGDRLAEVKLDNIKFGLYIGFFSRVFSLSAGDGSNCGLTRNAVCIIGKDVICIRHSAARSANGEAEGVVIHPAEIGEQAVHRAHVLAYGNE